MNDAGLDTHRSTRPSPVALADQEFSHFVQTRTRSLLRAAYLLTGDQHLAEDLVQSALARTHLSWRTLHDSANAEAYARKVMYHAQVSVWRRRRFTESLRGVVPEQLNVDDAASGVDLRLAVRSALGRLTGKQRAVLVLRYFEDRTEAETAALLNVSVGTVKSQTSYALDRLRTLAPELNGLADEVRVVDLEPEIRRASRGIRRRRTAAAVVAAFAVLAAIAGTILAVRPGSGSSPADDPTHRGTPETSTPAAAMPAAAGPVPSLGCPGVSTQARPAAELPVTLFFWRFDEAANCAILSRIGSGSIDVLATLPLRVNGNPGPLQTVELSPDGKRIAWVANDSDRVGDLAVLTLGDATPRLLGGSVSVSEGLHWDTDSTHLLVRTNDDGPYQVDTTTGASEVGAPLDAFVASANGAYLAAWTAKTLDVTRADGTRVYSVALTTEFECGCGFVPASMSEDGRRVVLSYGTNVPTDRVVGGKTILDAATGTVVPAPVTPASGYHVSQVVFGPDGQTVVVTDTEAGGHPHVFVVSATGVTTSQADLLELTGPIVVVQDQ